ncbi:MAG: hypothetical protein LBI81_02675 [Puniceicoccales bacterium]|nr:hypothetical protein [Puniceicoccales bacterium]
MRSPKASARAKKLHRARGHLAALTALPGDGCREIVFDFSRSSYTQNASVSALEDEFN